MHSRLYAFPRLAFLPCQSNCGTFDVESSDGQKHTNVISMMNKAVERDLLSLLPSITLPLPRELSEVAVSLLSQSRSKAGSLRQDEEIARGYVCANIACDR